MKKVEVTGLIFKKTHSIVECDNGKSHLVEAQSISGHKFGLDFFHGGIFPTDGSDIVDVRNGFKPHELADVIRSVSEYRKSEQRFKDE